MNRNILLGTVVGFLIAGLMSFSFAGCSRKKQAVSPALQPVAPVVAAPVAPAPAKAVADYGSPSTYKRGDYVKK